MATAKRRPLSGAGIDQLHQQSLAAVAGMHQVAESAVASSGAMLYLLNHADIGGEVETLLKAHLGDATAADNMQSEAHLMADCREFYRRLSDSQRRLMGMLFADLMHVGAGMELGTRRAGSYVEVVSTVDREARAS